MTNDGAGDRLTGLSKRIFVLILAMVIAGFVLPSPGIAARPGVAGPQSDYHSLGGQADPLLLLVPSIGIRAPILPISVDSAGVLHPPSNVHEVGWWSASAKIGSKRGQTLITGHTVHTGGGVMNQLGDLDAGAVVRIKTKRGILDYAVTKVIVLSKEQVAEQASDLFGQERKRNRLVLVTCTDWTGREYNSNIVVFANPLGVRNKPAKPAKPAAPASSTAGPAAA